MIDKRYFLTKCWESSDYPNKQAGGTLWKQVVAYDLSKAFDQNLGLKIGTGFLTTFSSPYIHVQWKGKIIQPKDSEKVLFGRKYFCNPDYQIYWSRDPVCFSTSDYVRRWTSRTHDHHIGQQLSFITSCIFSTQRLLLNDGIRASATFPMNSLNPPES